jgi:hypothetical protein
MTAVLDQVREELELWAAARSTASFWWRDDDAAEDGPHLRRLADVASRWRIVPALAVVPERVNRSVVERLSRIECCIWQHGWGHHFHTDGEFGDSRDIGRMSADAVAGQLAMDRTFGPRGWQRVFVPPNHCLSMRFKTLLPALGYLGVSAGIPLTPRLRHVPEVNAEIDVMDWPRQRILSAEDLADAVLRQLIPRRLRQLPLDMPVGILTHHLVFDAEAWELTTELFRLLAGHRAARFVRADTLFKPARVRKTSAFARWFRRPSTRDVTVVVTSCGRPDLFARTLDSFLAHNTYPVRRIVVLEDGEHVLPLHTRYPQTGFTWLKTGARIGQMAAIDRAYAAVDTEYIFHCEDDWEFYAPGFIEKSIQVLDSNPMIVQAWLRALDDTNNSPVLDYVFSAGGVPYKLIQPAFHSDEWGTWHGFSFNPGLKRRSDYDLVGSFLDLDPNRSLPPYEIERKASEFYVERGFLAAILADNGGRGYVKHIGWGRRVPPPGHETEGHG